MADARTGMINNSKMLLTVSPFIRLLLEVEMLLHTLEVDMLLHILEVEMLHTLEVEMLHTLEVEMLLHTLEVEMLLHTLAAVSCGSVLTSSGKLSYWFALSTDVMLCRSLHN